MAKDICLIKVDDVEKRLLIKGLLMLKEEQKREHKKYDYINELIIRICDAPIKRRRFFCEER